MHIRPARLGDASALAHVLIDTGRATYQGQIPDEVLFMQSLEDVISNIFSADGEHPK